MLRHRPPALILLIATAILLIAGACSTSGESTAPGGQSAPGEQAAALDTKESEPYVPDPIADPEVEPGTCEIVEYTPATSKEEQIGELCRPEDDQRDVAVMLIHGGSGIGGAYQGMQGWANRLLAEGYVTFAVDYHLFTPGSGGKAVFPQPEQNIKAATQYLRGTANALEIQRDRIVLQGFSAGARLAAVVYTSPDDPYFAGPELWPDISDAVNGLIGYYHPYDGSMQYSDQYYGGTDASSDPTVAQRWSVADSLANADNAVGPALFVTGSRDWDLIEAQQLEFAEALEDESIAAQQKVISGGGHGFDTTGTRLTRLGEQSATLVLVWLNDEFPQHPGRDAQTGEVDLASAPDRTGDVPTTFATRTRPSGSSSYTTTTTWRATASSTTSTTYAASSPTSATSSTTTPTPPDPPPTSTPTSTETGGGGAGGESGSSSP